MVIMQIIRAILEKETKVIVPINCNVPEHDDEYIQIEIKEPTIAE